MPTPFDADRMFTYLKGYFSALKWDDALNALTFAKRAHDGQFRKSGEPYLVHPLTITCHAMALGVKSETVAAAGLLHDVVEDCGVRVDQLPVKNPDIKDVVRRLTHVKSVPLDAYYAEIANSPEATLVKLFDRCDNVSTMAGVFRTEKTLDYIKETDDYVMPLHRKAKDYWPQYSDALFVLKYHIRSVDDGLRAVLTAADKDVKGKA